MKKYRIYFEQVNQTRYEVEAKSQGVAIDKALAEWRRENKYPTLLAVETDD